MKNNFIKNKNKNVPKKAKKTWSYYLVIFAMLFCLVGSFLGTIGFARTFADEDLPLVTNHTAVRLENGVDLSNKWVAVPISDNEEELQLFDISELFFLYGTSVTFDIDGVSTYNVPYGMQVKEGYYLFYLDFNQYKTAYDEFVESGDIRDYLTDMVVSSVNEDIDMYYYVPFNDGVGVLGTITGTLTGGIVSLGNGIGSGLSTLANSIFINSSGNLSVFGVLVCIFGALSLVFGLCRLVVRWLGTLGGRKV